MRKMRENLKNRRNPSHQISENFGKSWNFVIFWYFGFIKVYFVFWYFACISYFNFEIFKIPHPGAAHGLRGLDHGRRRGRSRELGARGEQQEAAAQDRVQVRVERFDRRPIEPFELFTSEFGQNSVRIQENSSRIFRKFLKFEKFSTFSKVFSEIPRNFRQNRCKIRWKSVEN